MEPTAEPLGLPEAYGRATDPLAWETVRAELEEAPAYWVSSVRPDGRPHAVPVDGIWLDDVLYYGGAEETVHVRSARANPSIVMHIGDGSKAIIVEGEAGAANPSEVLAKRLAKASKDKYGYSPGPEGYANALALSPSRVLAWMAFPKDATRFLFGRRG
jgi:hypothetical protein